jgi:hypothetical protein
MTLPVNRPLTDEGTIVAWSTSIGATPTAATGVCTKAGRVERCSAVSIGTTSGTITFTVATAAGTVGTFTMTGGAAATAYADFGDMAPNAVVNEGDTVTITPSGGGGTTIPGLITVVVR